MPYVGICITYLSCAMVDLLGRPREEARMRSWKRTSSLR
jgi:hypothetical protein